MTKPCKLAILKRSIAEPSILTMDCQPEYWVGSECSPIARDGWVMLQSNAQLLNRRDAQRDLLENEDFKNKNRIWYADVYHETKFELVELIEKKSFGWVIKQKFPTSGDTWLFKIHMVDISQDPVFDLDLQWSNSQHSAQLLSDDLKNVLMEKLKQAYPESKFEAIELFTE